MNRFALGLAMCALFVPVQASAQQYATPAPDATAAPNPFIYSDPAMMFTAPPEYLRVPLPAYDPARFEQPTVEAAWVRNPGKREQITITITMENTDGNVDGFESVSENEVRTKVDSVFFKKHELTKLANGMPAYWQELSMGSGFDELKRFSYVWADGLRGVTLAMTGRYGLIDEPVAKKALANTMGVAYPKNRI